MKLAFFNDYIPGRVEGDEITDLSVCVGPEIMALPAERRIQAIIDSFDTIQTILKRYDGPASSLADVQLRAPVLKPSKMLFVLANYPEGAGSPKGRLTFALKAVSSILDPDGTVILPERDAKIFHHEAELAVVMGKRARNVSEEDALNYVLGYTCALDVTARGLGYGLGVDSNSFDTFCPLGPWLVTRDDLADPQSLQVRHWQDDDLREDYTTADMEWSVAELIAAASRVGTLEPGDVLACGVNHQQLGAMQDGERSVMEISAIGKLGVTVSDPLKRSWPKGIDHGLAEAATQARVAGTPLNLKLASMAQVS